MGIKTICFLVIPACNVSYGGMDITNHIERHWEGIKYTLLQGKVNHSLQDLIVVIIGVTADSTRVGGPTLLDHFQQVQLISEFSLIFLHLYHG